MTENVNISFAEDLRLTAPLTIEEAPEGFLLGVMAKIEGLEFEVEKDVSENSNVVPLPTPTRKNRRISRLLPAVAAVAMILAATALTGVFDRSSAEDAAMGGMPIAEESQSADPRAGAPLLMAEPSLADAESLFDQDFATSNDMASNEAEQTDRADAPSEFAGAEQPAAPTLFGATAELPSDTALFSDDALPKEEGELSLLYITPEELEEIAFHVILVGGVAPVDIEPTMPNMYLVTELELDEIMKLQPTHVVAEHMEEGLTETAECGLLEIK